MAQVKVKEVIDESEIHVGDYLLDTDTDGIYIVSVVDATNEDRYTLTGLSSGNTYFGLRSWDDLIKSITEEDCFKKLTPNSVIEIVVEE